jgi:hypothetical protein
MIQRKTIMPFKKGQSGNPKGRKKGAKSVLSESFYELGLRYLDDPDGFGGYEGFKAFFNKCPRNKEIFVSMMAKWAEKQIKQSLEVGGENGGPIAVTLTKTVTTVKPQDYAGE